MSPALLLLSPMTHGHNIIGRLKRHFIHIDLERGSEFPQLVCVSDAFVLILILVELRKEMNDTAMQQREPSSGTES